MVSVKYDKETNSLYIKFKDEKVTKTEPIGKDRFMDLNAEGKIIGIEILNEFETKYVDFVEAVKKTEEIEISA